MALPPEIMPAVLNIAVVVLGILAAFLAALGAWGLSIFERKLGIAKDDRAAATINAALANGIALGTKIVADKIAAGERVNNPAEEVKAVALNYAEPKVQAEMKQLSIEPSSLPERTEARVAVAMQPATDTKSLNLAELKRLKGKTP